VVSANLQDVGRIFDSQSGKGFVLWVLEWRLTSHIILIYQYILCLRALQGFSYIVRASLSVSSGVEKYPECGGLPTVKSAFSIIISSCGTTPRRQSHDSLPT